MKSKKTKLQNKLGRVKTALKKALIDFKIDFLQNQELLLKTYVFNVLKTDFLFEFKTRDLLSKQFSLDFTV